MIKISKVKRACGAVIHEKLCRENTKAIVDIAHFWPRYTLIIFDHFTVVEKHVTGIPLSSVAKNGHQRRQMTLPPARFDLIKSNR